MAVTPQGSTTTNTSSDARTVITQEHTVSSGSNRYLIVGLVAGGHDWGTSCTYAGKPMFPLHSQRVSASGNVICELWGQANPTSGANDVVYTGESMAASSLTIQEFVGNEQISPVGGAARKTQVSGTSMSQTIKTIFDDEMLVCVGAGYGGDTDPVTEGSGWNLLDQGATGTNTNSDYSYILQNKAAGVAGDKTADFTLSASDNSSLAVVGLREAASDTGAVRLSQADANGGGASSISSTAITVESGDDILLAFIGCDDDIDVSSVQWDGNGGEALARITDSVFVQGTGGTGIRGEVWWMATPTPDTDTVTATLSGSSSEQFIAVQLWTDVGTTPGNAAANSDGAELIEVSITPSVDNAILACFHLCDYSTVNYKRLGIQYGWQPTTFAEAGSGADLSGWAGFKRVSGTSLARTVGGDDDCGTSAERGMSVVVLAPTGAAPAAADFLPVLAMGANF